MNQETSSGQTTPTTSLAVGPVNFETFQWPSAEKAVEVLRSSAPQALLHGLPGSAKAFFLAFAYERLKEPQPWVLVTPNREESLLLYDDPSAWLPQVPIHLCPSWEVLPQDAEPPDPELIGQRQRAFYHLLEGTPGIVISPLLGALQRTPPPEEWLEEILILKKGRAVPANWKERLLNLGYEAVTQVVAAGQFATRGGILDLSSPGSPSGPVRLEFFG